jgi:hypothetical protein
LKIIPSLIIKADDLEASRISAAENLQREDLSAIETIEAIVEIEDVDLIEDAELIEDKQYASMGKNPANRVRALLGKLDTMRRSQERGSDVSGHSKMLSNKFIGQVEKIFKNLIKPMEWLSFLNHDLPILIDFCEEVREASMQNRLNRSQTRALERLRAASEPEFQRVTAHARMFPDSETEHVSRDFSQINLRDLSGREIEEIAYRAAKKNGCFSSVGSCFSTIFLNSWGLIRTIQALICLLQRNLKKQF